MTNMRSSLLAAIAVGLLAVSMTSGVPEAPAAPPSASGADFSGLVDVGGGHMLYLDCRGNGSPTVVLQSGFGNAADIWSVADADPPAVQPGVATFTRVCSYDRPGSVITTSGPEPLPGRSDQVPMPRNPADVVTELHDLLAAAQVPGPYVLVGHSLGGPLNLRYARTYPDQVSAMVMVDSPLPLLRTLVTPQQWAEFANLQLPAGISPPGYAAEQYDVGMLFDEIVAAPPLRPVPLVVMTRGEPDVPDPLPPNISVDTLAAFDRAAPQAQAELAASAAGAEHVTVPSTTHYIQTQRPDTVIAAIRRVSVGGPNDFCRRCSEHPTC